MSAAEDDLDLPTFVIPLYKSILLIPNATVAEIIAYEPLQRVQGSPDWFLGFLGWRGVQVPVVSFEMLTVGRGSFSLVSVSSASLVVVKACSSSPSSTRRCHAWSESTGKICLPPVSQPNGRNCRRHATPKR
jgi:hypothetical protein